MPISIIRKIHGTAVIAASLRNQKLIPYWPKRRLEEIRDRRIRDMVQYAARVVPYYRDMFARERIDPRDIKTATDLDRLPIVSRETVRANPSGFLSEANDSRGALSFKTSGSTGTPSEISHDRRSLLANVAFGERERDPIVRHCRSFRPKELYVGYETSTFKKVIKFYNDSVLMPVRPHRTFVHLQEPIETVAATLNKERPEILVGYGGWIDLFFRSIAALRIEIHPPKLVLYMGEALPHGARSFIEQNYGIPVWSRYNAVEAFKIGYYCEQQSGFHIHEDLCRLRIVDPGGRDVQPGVQGEIVISNLINKATVLLNYSIGDLAAAVESDCPCGRSFKRISELEGRVEDVLPLSDGRFIHPRSIWEVFKRDPELLQYQIVQQDWNRFELVLVTVDAESYQRVLARILPGLKSLLGREPVIRAEFRSGSNRIPGMKFRAVVSKIKHTGA